MPGCYTMFYQCTIKIKYRQANCCKSVERVTYLNPRLAVRQARTARLNIWKVTANSSAQLSVGESNLVDFVKVGG